MQSQGTITHSELWELRHDSFLKEYTCKCLMKLPREVWLEFLIGFDRVYDVRSARNREFEVEDPFLGDERFLETENESIEGLMRVTADAIRS